MSRFHRADVSATLPWVVPPVEDLAVDADVRVVNANTIAITPRSQALPANASPQSPRSQALPGNASPQSPRSQALPGNALKRGSASPRSQALPGNALKRGSASRVQAPDARQSLLCTGSQAEPGNQGFRFPSFPGSAWERSISLVPRLCLGTQYFEALPSGLSRREAEPLMHGFPGRAWKPGFRLPLPRLLLPLVLRQQYLPQPHRRRRDLH